MSSLLCPACGSTDVEVTEHAQQHGVPFGPSVAATQVKNVCRSCGEAGDFEGVNDDRITLARTESTKESIPKMLAMLAGVGLSMAYIERALELPTRTVARWKAGDTSAAGVALLRLITMFPWLLTVAEHGFKRDYANATVVKEAARILHFAADASGTVYSGHVARSGSYINVQFNAKVPTVAEPQIEARVSLIARGA